jgi:hypothetical protein
MYAGILNKFTTADGRLHVLELDEIIMNPVLFTRPVGAMNRNKVFEEFSSSSGESKEDSSSVVLK